MLPSSRIRIRVEHVSVRYRAPQQRVGTLKEYAIRRLQQQVKFADFYALKDVNLEVHEGEIVGIIGRNGAGKSTLLKVVSRVLFPTSGRIWIQGRVSPLLEISGGFNNELTGRENVFLAGTLLGRTHREVQDRLEEILDFSELGPFIDAPTRTYSSGMVGRLGFAVATTWRPDILIIDEVLSTGDMAFRKKCELRMQEFRPAGTTTLLVAHGMDTIMKMCSRVAWLEHGVMREVGEPSEVIAAYTSALQSTPSLFESGAPTDVHDRVNAA